MERPTRSYNDSTCLPSFWARMLPQGSLNYLCLWHTLWIREQILQEWQLDFHFTQMALQTQSVQNSNEAKAWQIWPIYRQSVRFFSFLSCSSTGILWWVTQTLFRTDISELGVPWVIRCVVEVEQQSVDWFSQQWLPQSRLVALVVQLPLDLWFVLVLLKYRCPQFLDRKSWQPGVSGVQVKFLTSYL